MPQDSLTRLTETGAEELLHGICFKTGPPRLLGAELEWLVFDAERPGRPVSHERLAAAHDAARALPSAPASPSSRAVSWSSARPPPPP